LTDRSRCCGPRRTKRLFADEITKLHSLFIQRDPQCTVRNLEIMNTVRLALFAALLFPPAAFAKRIPAPVIEPVVHKGVRYTVPNDRGTVGYAVAWDVATGKQERH